MSMRLPSSVFHRTCSTALVRSVVLISGCFVAVESMHASATIAAHASTQDSALPNGEALVRACSERIGGSAWRELKSFESKATVKSAMGNARIEYSFIAPSSHLLVQSSPTDARVMEMGSTPQGAWMGEPGHAQAVDPAMANEMAGGGDLQTLVHSLEERFEQFETIRRATVDSRVVWVVAMLPRGAATAEQRWTLYIDATSGLPHGFDIPAPISPAGSDAQKAPATSPQTIRFSRFEAVEHPPTLANGDRMLAFREAIVTASGVQTTLVYSKVAVDMLAADAIKTPLSLGSSSPPVHAKP